ncbi:hypothetical protein ACK39C_07830 [Aeromonas veronii]
MKDHLTWMAMNFHEWPYPSCDTCFIGHGYHDQVLVHSDSISGLSPHGRHQVSKQKWLARRAELSNKPSWKDINGDIHYLSQCADGQWIGHSKQPKAGQECYECDCKIAYYEYGEVLGDWKNTIEQRPVDLSEPVVGVKERGADGAEELNAMAQRLLVALKSDPRSFDTGALAEMVELADAEIVKRDAAVCGGEGYLNNHWFERGELPPVGVKCEVLWGDGEWYMTNVLAHLHINSSNICPVFTTEWDDEVYVACMPCYKFRPIRTERDLAVEEMMKDAGALQWETPKSIMLSLYDAGYRKQISPAK